MSIPKLIYDATTITFELPPTGDNINEKVSTNARTTLSSNGTEQTQFNYNSQDYVVNFAFLTQALVDEMRTFFLTHGSKGKSFDYFLDKDLVDFETYTLSKKEFSPKRLFPDDAGGFIHDLRLSMRRTL